MEKLWNFFSGDQYEPCIMQPLNREIWYAMQWPRWTLHSNSREYIEDTEVPNPMTNNL